MSLEQDLSRALVDAKTKLTAAEALLKGEQAGANKAAIDAAQTEVNAAKQAVQKAADDLAQYYTAQTQPSNAANASTAPSTSSGPSSAQTASPPPGPQPVSGGTAQTSTPAPGASAPVPGSPPPAGSASSGPAGGSAAAAAPPPLSVDEGFKESAKLTGGHAAQVLLANVALGIALRTILAPVAVATAAAVMPSASLIVAPIVLGGMVGGIMAAARSYAGQRKFIKDNHLNKKVNLAAALKSAAIGAAFGIVSAGVAYELTNIVIGGYEAGSNIVTNLKESTEAAKAASPTAFASDQCLVPQALIPDEIVDTETFVRTHMPEPVADGHHHFGHGSGHDYSSLHDRGDWSDHRTYYNNDDSGTGHVRVIRGGAQNAPDKNEPFVLGKNLYAYMKAHNLPIPKNAIIPKL
ncbi:MAG: hypothetical protein PHE27_01780 [Alphaproteobacteria bacterium]|nr:hypothetical protein [Alphaproteobacteria bacterium]